MKNQVRKYRKRQGLSGEKLSRLAEMSASDLSKLERGQVFPHPGWRARIADALAVEEKTLFPEVHNDA